MRGTAQDVFWLSIIGSALVAAVVTLLLEYFAKPALEVRKDRVLHQARAKRETIAAMRRATFAIGRILTYRHEEPDAWNDHIVNLAKSAEEIVIDSVPKLDVDDTLDDWWYKVTPVTCGFLILVQHEWPSEDAWDDIDRASDQLEAILDAAELPRYRVLKRRRLLENLERAETARHNTRRESSSGRVP